MIISNLLDKKIHRQFMLSSGGLVFMIGGYILILTFFIKGMLQANEGLIDKNEIILMTLILTMEYCFVNHNYPNKIIKDKQLFFIEMLLISNFMAYGFMVLNFSTCLVKILEFIVNILFSLVNWFL